MNEMIWFVIGFTITLIILAISDTIVTCKVAPK